MNILFLHRNWPSFGGGETVTKCLARELIRRGHNVCVAFFRHTVKEGDSINPDEHIRAFCLENVPFDENSSEYFIKKSIARDVKKRILAIVEKERIDLVINQWWPVEFLDGVREKKDVKVIKCLHMDPAARKNLNGVKNIVFFRNIYRFLEKKKHIWECDKYVKNSDMLVFLAESFMNYYCENTLLKDVKHKINYVNNPLVYDSDFEEYDIGRKTKTLLFVGRLLEKHKQVTKILYAWKKIYSMHKDWSLQIVGDGPDRLLYEKMSRELGLNNVSFEGFKNPLPYYQRASIFLMSSAYEGWGMTLVESMQNGTVPVVMNTFSALCDIIQSGENGVVVPPVDEQFVNAIDFLIRDDESRNRMARKGLATCKRYSVENIVDEWESVFRSLMS